MTDDNGRLKAENVTGPMGAYVQGAPRRTRMDYDSFRGGFGSSNFGSGGFGGGGGFGDGSFGSDKESGSSSNSDEPSQGMK